MKDKFSEWLKKIQKIHPKADEEVLRFIYDFSVKQGYGEAEEVLYQQFANGYCYYFASTLVSILAGSTLCKNSTNDHYFILYNNKYYDARVFFNVQNKRCSIPTKVVNNEVLVEDLDGEFIVPKYIDEKNYLTEYIYAGQFGDVRSSVKDAIWKQIYLPMYNNGMETVSLFNQTMKR